MIQSISDGKKGDLQKQVFLAASGTRAMTSCLVCYRLNSPLRRWLGVQRTCVQRGSLSWHDLQNQQEANYLLYSTYFEDYWLEAEGCGFCERDTFSEMCAWNIAVWRRKGVIFTNNRYQEKCYYIKIPWNVAWLYGSTFLFVTHHMVFFSGKGGEIDQNGVGPLQLQLHIQIHHHWGHGELCWWKLSQRAFSTDTFLLQGVGKSCLLHQFTEKKCKNLRNRTYCLWWW